LLRGEMDLMKSDEQGESDAEHDQRNKEVAVSEKGAGFRGEGHLRPVDSRITDANPAMAA
jgi:hypothetical protein